MTQTIDPKRLKDSPGEAFQSPVFNPIKNLWELKVNVHAQKPHSVDEVEQFAMEEHMLTWLETSGSSCCQF